MEVITAKSPLQERVHIVDGEPSLEGLGACADLATVASAVAVTAAVNLVEAKSCRLEMTASTVSATGSTIASSAPTLESSQMSSRPRSLSCVSGASSALTALSSDAEADEAVAAAEVVKAAPKQRKNRADGSTPPTSADGSSQQKRKKTGASGLRASQGPGKSEYEVKDRKAYLDAGLYNAAVNAASGQKQQPGRLARTASVNRSKPARPSKATLEAMARTFTWELPLHHGATLLEQHRDFRLPWDILNDFDLSRLPDTVEGVAYRSDALDRMSEWKHPAPYKQIKQNRLVWRAKDDTPRKAICGCTEGNCGDDCLNRVMQFFCSSKLCSFGNKCTNLPFSQRPNRHDLEVFWTGNRGFGLRTNTPIVAGDFIMSYVGEIITVNESYRRVTDEYQDRHDYYFLSYVDAEVIDAGLVGNEARFVNHSCDPNVHVVRWKLADYDEYEIGLFALRDIDPKEELSYDYGWSSFSSIDAKDAEEPATVEEKPKQKCLCAGESCTGFLEKSEKMKERKKQLLAQTKAAARAAKRKPASADKPASKRAKK